MSLPITALAVVGCGPQVVLEDGTGHSTEGDSETDGGPSPTTITVGDTDTSPVTTSPPPQCTSADDCGPGFTCQNNVCVPDDDYCYGDYGGYYGGDCCYDDCCYGDCYYNECYSDQDCGTAELCQDYEGFGYECQPVPLLEQCPLPEVAELPVPMWGAGIVSLAFVEADGDGLQDLAIGRPMATELVRGPGDGSPTPLPVSASASMAHAVSGDFNGDMIADIATIGTDGTLSIATGDGMGGFAAASEIPGIPAISGLHTLQWDTDGHLDLAGFTAGADAIVIHGDGLGSTLALSPFSPTDEPLSMVTGELDGDGRRDLVLQGGGDARTYLAATDDVVPDGSISVSEQHGQRWLLASVDVDGNGLSEIVGGTPITDWLLLQTWRDSGTFDTAAVLFTSGDPSLSGAGDVDGDGVPDVVIVDGSELVVLLGSGSAAGVVFQCQGRIPLGFFPQSLSVGDFSGDGRAEVAARDDQDTLRLLSPL